MKPERPVPTLLLAYSKARFLLSAYPPITNAPQSIQNPTSTQSIALNRQIVLVVAGS
jgi:hypothetical protein